MKRLISILIIVAVLASFCPAALADDDVEALMKRIAELEAEIEKKDAIIEALTAALTGMKNTEQNNDVGVVVIPSGGNQPSTKHNVPGNDLPEELSTPLGDDQIVIEACKTKFIEYDTYTQMRMSVKVKNLTEYSPPNTYIGISITPIDINGDALDGTFYMGSTDIAPSGKAQWLEAICNVEGAVGIRILGYRIYGDVSIQGSFETPIELYSKDYKIIYDEIKGTGY